MKRMARPSPALAGILACTCLAAAVATAAPGGVRPPGQAQPVIQPSGRERPVAPGPPVVGEYRYRMWAGIRPLLFWIGRDNVGGGRIVIRRDASGVRGFELLIGSDPRRAPTGINRWGYIREVARGGDAELLGVMKRSDEQSPDEAKARVADEKGGYYFKRIQSVSTGDETTSTVSLARVRRDFTYRDLANLLEAMRASVEASATQRMRVPPGARSGFLMAVADVIHADVEAYRQSNWHLRGRGPVTVTHVYNARLYDLVLVSSRLVKRRRLGDHTYDLAVEAAFTSGQHGTSNPDHFRLVYGVDGRYAEIPLSITYQPRWWFKAELVLDGKETF